MHRHGVKSVLISAAVVLTALVSCSDRGRVIPASKLTDIYVDMFLSDQWLSSHYSSRKTADTTLFYEPIFRKYGYTVKDYDASVKHYIEKPDEYAKILKTASIRLDNKAKYLRKVDDYYSRKKEVSHYVEKPFNLETLMPEDTMMTWHFSDSLFLADTLGVADSLAVTDSLAAVDTLAVTDSLAAGVDSLKVDSLAVKVDSAVVAPKPEPVVVTKEPLARHKVLRTKDSIRVKKIRTRNEQD